MPEAEQQSTPEPTQAPEATEAQRGLRSRTIDFFRRHSLVVGSTAGFGVVGFVENSPIGGLVSGVVIGAGLEWYFNRVSRKTPNN